MTDPDRTLSQKAFAYQDLMRFTQHFLEQEREALIYLAINPDPSFTPGSTPGFGPDSESTSVAVGRNKMTEPLDFTYLTS